MSMMTRGGCNFPVPAPRDDPIAAPPGAIAPAVACRRILTARAGGSRRPVRAIGCRVVATSLLCFPAVFAAVVAAFDSFYGPPAPAQAALPLAWAGSAYDAPAVYGLIRDDAGRMCLPSELALVEACVQTGWDAYGGHAWLRTPTRAVGFRAVLADIHGSDYLNPFSPPSAGMIGSDSTRRCDRVLRYRAAPRTVRLLEKSIDRHAADPYQLGSWGGGRNCATWAADRLREAGLTPPPGGCPNRMARYMHPAGEESTGGAAERQPNHCPRAMSAAARPGMPTLPARRAAVQRLQVGDVHGIADH